jgi:hypothetical protein
VEWESLPKKKAASDVNNAYREKPESTARNATQASIVVARTIQQHVSTVHQDCTRIK